MLDPDVRDARSGVAVAVRRLRGGAGSDDGRNRRQRGFDPGRALPARSARPAAGIRSRCVANNNGIAMHMLERRCQCQRLVSNWLFVSPECAVPGGLTTEQFRLEPLGPQHNDADYAAWTASSAHIQATPGFAG